MGTRREGKAGRRGLSARLTSSLPNPESKRGSAASRKSTKSFGGFFSNWNHHLPKVGSQVSPRGTQKKGRCSGRAGGSGAREEARRGRLGRSPESALLPRESASLPGLARGCCRSCTPSKRRRGEGAGRRGRDPSEREGRPAPAQPGPAQPWIPATLGPGALGPCPKSRV